ncbi:MAG: hypothetical protein ACFCVD_06765 [Nodosilinea sp.]
MKENRLGRSFRSDHLLYLLLFAFISYALFRAFAIDKQLSADGAHYFRSILDAGDFTRFAWSRQFANYLTQWPLVAAIQLGRKDIPALKKLFAVGLYFPYIASYLFCIYANRRENHLLLAFPLISMVGINLSADYILIGEHHVMVLLAWPILLLSLRKEPLTWLDGGLLWVLLCLFTRTYEAAIVSTLIFGIVFATRLYKFRQSRRQVIIFSLSFLLSALAFLIALYFILNPRDVANKSGFITGLRAFFGNEAALVSASTVFLMTAGLMVRKNFIILMSLIPIALYGMIVATNTHGPTAAESFASRTLSLALLPLLMVCAVATSYFNLRPNRLSTGVVALLIGVVVVGNLKFSNDWYTFRSQVEAIVTTERGYVPIESTVIDDSLYRWEWNNSELSIILSYPCVRAIVLNGTTIQWQPYDPREKLVLKDFVGYDAFFRGVDPEITLCQ